jgi:hypothetical protein
MGSIGSKSRLPANYKATYHYKYKWSPEDEVEGRFKKHDTVQVRVPKDQPFRDYQYWLGMSFYIYIYLEMVSNHPLTI